MAGSSRPSAHRRLRQLDADWSALPVDLLATLLSSLDLPSRVAAASACRTWRSAATELPNLWPELSCATHRTGSRRTELRRLLSLAAFARRYGGGTRSLVVSARVPPDAQPAALKAVSQAALAAAASLNSLQLVTNRGFWPAWLPSLRQLRTLHLDSKEGGLSLTGDLRPLEHLTSLQLAARHCVTLADSLRLPPSLLSVELSAVRDTLPPPLAQLPGLRRLAVRRSVLSEGLLLTEYEVLSTLTALTALALECQGDETWLVPPELAALTVLADLSLSGNDCSRWPLHGSDELFDQCLQHWPHLTSLDLSGCSLEDLPRALSGGEAAAAAADGGDGAGGGPRLLRVLVHGNQLEAEGEDEGSTLAALPRSLRQLSCDLQAALHDLVPHSSMRPPRGCRQLALVGVERGAAVAHVAILLRVLLCVLPELRHLLLQPEMLDALDALHGGGGTAGSAEAPLTQVAGRWRPARLPGQPKRREGAEPHPLQPLLQEGVQIMALPDDLSQLPALMSRLAAEDEERAAADSAECAAALLL